MMVWSLWHLCVAFVVLYATHGIHTASQTEESILQEGHDILSEFYVRYNATPEVDLIFVLDRSGSVPRQGWNSMLNFVKDILKHFTVDKNNTRVAMVTFSTRATIDINDVTPGVYTDSENKCTLNKRIKDYMEIKVPHGYTATFEGLQLARHILMDSRPSAKKAVFVLTDGKSNIGPPPVKVAFDILSLQWDVNWDEATLGPQVEIYAFGIERAQISELQSIASDLPHHVFLIPNFQLFEQLARSLHGNQQEESWLVAQLAMCGPTCGTTGALCMCGTRQGQYSCGCNPGAERVFERNAITCIPCREGYYKETQSPDPCIKCPVNMTTYTEGATSIEQCELLPGLRECPDLPDIRHGSKFFVAGTSKTEVLNTGLSCNSTTDGNSCHYECEEGYRLSGSPIMVCNDSGAWEGQIPNCKVINCQTLELINWHIDHATVHYINTTTTYGSFLEVSCDSNRVALGTSVWACGKHGRWTKPTNFKCAEVFCSALPPSPALIFDPPQCGAGEQPLNQNCSFSCDRGYQLIGDSSTVCEFELHSAWSSHATPTCKDVEAPVITCPKAIEVMVSDWGQNTTIIYYDVDQPTITDNSGRTEPYQVLGAPEDSVFRVGNVRLTYQVEDEAGNKAKPCYRNILVKGKDAQVLRCPSDISLPVNTVLRNRRVEWEEPKFVGPDNETLEYTCNVPSNSTFNYGTNQVVCHADLYPVVKCQFDIHITDAECPVPYMDRLPKYGSLVCGEGDYLYPKVCRIMCSVGFTLVHYKADHMWNCQWDGTWTLEKPWPNCARTFSPNKVLTEDELTIRYEGDCETSKDTIKEAFSVTVFEILKKDHQNCHLEERCAIDNVQVICGYRSKRSTSSISSILHFLSRPFRAARSVESNEDVVRVQFTLSTSVPTDPVNVTETEQHELYQNLGEIFFNIKDTLEQSNIDINGSSAVIEEVNFLSQPRFDLNCSEDHVVQIGEMDAMCYQCPPGSYLSNGTSCELCPFHTYQDEEGQRTCMDCPSGTFTLYEGATEVDQCKAPCAPGHYSSTGYEPCVPCQTGSYQDQSAATSCQPCLNGYSTAHEGATNSTQCKEKCPPNSFSSEGVLPCNPCALGSHQKNTGQTQCVACTPHVTDSYCPIVVNCSETAQQCGNGSCIVTNGTVGCLCDPGYHGDLCDLEIDECEVVTCENNGTCIDGLNSFDCVCAEGYAGRLCEITLNPCDSPLCHYGYCVNHHHSYECICQDGWNGTNCEENMDECASDPCFHGNCTDGINEFSCMCDPYFTGALCDVLVDLCSGMNCNRGTCHMGAAGPYCQCKKGYTGEFCDTRIDHCESAPCHNNARCNSMNDGYVCKCKRGYGGQDCALEVSPFFDLVFPSSGIENFVMLRRPIRNLYEMTLVFWVRTWDVYNFGTILSYAVEDSWMSQDKNNILTIYDCANLQIHVNGEVVHSNVSLNDGWWHHIAVTWESGGVWQLYLNGSLTAHGTGVSAKQYIQDDGYLVLGQEQDSVGGGFNERESFVGELSQLNIYDYVLDRFVVMHLANQSAACVLGHGNVLKWTEVVGYTYGNVEIRNDTRCLDVNECLLESTNNCTAPSELCEDTSGGYTCVPCDGQSPYCAEAPPPDPCDEVTCHNGGECEVIEGTNVKCHCLGYFTELETTKLIYGGDSSVRGDGGGRGCEVRADSTYTIPEHKACKNCWHSKGSYCEVALNPNPHSCKSNPCLNGGKCDYVENDVICTCPKGYDGELCQEVTDLCRFQQCKNGGQCVVTEHKGQKDFRCDCSGPWKGRYCHVFYQPKCSFNPCLNDGVCVINTNSLDGYKCLCPATDEPGLQYGPNCELQHPCDDKPCRHNGACIVVDENRYLCVCMVDFNGNNCEMYKDQLITMEPSTAIDLCSSVECSNGGSCMEGKCHCDMEYTGDKCTQEREKESYMYRSVVTLDLPYDSSLPSNQGFKSRFIDQVVDLYKQKAPKSKVTVHINSIMKGSVVVDFTVTHFVFADSELKAQEEMQEVLEEELQKGTLGNFKANTERFTFEEVKEVSDPSVLSPVSTWLYAVIGVLIAVIILVVMFLAAFVIRRRRRNAKHMMKLETRMDRVRFTKGGRTVGGAVEFPLHEESIYSEPEDDNRRNRARQWQNSDWVARQTIPLPPKPDEQNLLPGQRIALEDQQRQDTLRATQAKCGASQESLHVPGGSGSSAEYLAPCKGTPPPSYRVAMENKNKDDVTAAATEIVEDEYFTPISDEQADLIRQETLRSMNPEQGIVNTSFDEDQYLQPKKDMIESDHESDEEVQRKKPSAYIPMDKRKTPEILVSPASPTLDGLPPPPPPPSEANAEVNGGGSGSDSLGRASVNSAGHDLPSMYLTTSGDEGPNERNKLVRQPAEHSVDEEPDVESEA